MALISQVPAGVPYQFWSAVFFVFGCAVGSFLNVCIYRLPRGMSIVTPPSHCPHCGEPIPWYRNVPVVTWIVQQGRCAACGGTIAARYVLVELLTGLLFFLLWVAHGDVSLGGTVALCLLAAGLIAATFIDLEHFIIPDAITLGGIGAGLVCSALAPALHGQPAAWAAVKQSALGVAVGAALVYLILRAGKLLFGKWRKEFPEDTRIVFTENELVLPDERIPYDELFYRRRDVIRFQAQQVELVDRCRRDVPVTLSMETLRLGEEELKPAETPHLEAVVRELTLPREAMGLGDVKFMAALGAFLGWKAVLFIIMLSAIMGASVGLSLIALRRQQLSARLPYGPFIAAAAVAWMFVGPRVVRWFLGE